MATDFTLPDFPADDPTTPENEYSAAYEAWQTSGAWNAESAASTPSSGPQGIDWPTGVGPGFDDWTPPPGWEGCGEGRLHMGYGVCVTNPNYPVPVEKPDVQIWCEAQGAEWLQDKNGDWGCHKGGLPPWLDPANEDGDGVEPGGPSSEMRDDFYAALSLAGMSREMIESLWLWAEDQWEADPSMTAQRLLLGMYESDAFKARFPGLTQLSDDGVARRDMPTPGQYIAFEKHVAAELKRTGVSGEPAAGGYAGRNAEGLANFDVLITSLISGGVGKEEVTERLDAAQRVVWEMPQAVRDKLADWFGDNAGTSITMKTFLDPDDSWARVQDDISTAQTGGWGTMVAGLDRGWTEGLAKRVSDTGLSQRDQWLRFAELKEQEMLYQENVGEMLGHGAVDLDYAREGVEVAFDLEPTGFAHDPRRAPGWQATGDFATGYDLSETVKRRARTRSARFSGGGGAMISGTTTGFGATNA